MKVIKICIGSSCHARGSFRVVETFKRLIEEKNLEESVKLEGSFCMGRCHEGVSVQCDGEYYSVRPDSAKAAFNKIIGEK